MVHYGILLSARTHAKAYITELYLDQLTFCKVKSLCHEGYHDVATICLDSDKTGQGIEGLLGGALVYVGGGAVVQSGGGAARAR